MIHSSLEVLRFLAVMPLAGKDDLGQRWFSGHPNTSYSWKIKRPKAGFCLSQKTVDFQLLWTTLVDISGLRQYGLFLMLPDFDENGHMKK